MGAYGLVQGSLQIPFGWLSDRHGRKRMLYIGLAIFAAGSFVAASSESPWIVIAGRALQGAGAISGVAIATAADLTRESQRTKAMAIIGSTIGAAFALSFILAPSLEHAFGVPGIFAMTGVLVILAMAVVRWVVPDPPPRVSAPGAAAFMRVLKDRELQRLNVGIFALHAVLMAMFVVVPLALARDGLLASQHWMVYLGTVGVGFVLMLPAIMSRAASRERAIFLGSVATILLSLVVLLLGLDRIGGIVAALVIFFAGFNVLEAKLPALVSRAAPTEARGAATGLYSSVQFLGTFVGGAAGGALAQHAGYAAVLFACLAITVAWLAAAWSMGEFAPAASSATRT
jgi:MFS family permease